jgi:hypothetical protein
MKTLSYTITSEDDPILDDSFDVVAFYGKSYDS